MIERFRKVKLAELFEIKHGFAFKSEYYSADGKYQLVTLGNFIDKGGFKNIEGKEKFYTGTFPSEYILKENNLIIAMTQQVEGLLGSTAIIPKSDAFVLNQRVGLIRCNNNVYKPFVNYLMRSKYIRKQIESTAQGTKQRNTSPNKIYDITAWVPEFKEQKLIGDFLTDLDTKIGVNNKINKELEVMAKTIYDYWFVQFDFPDKNGRPYKSSGGKMVYNAKLKREIPEGWEVKYLTDEMDLQYGFPFSTTLFNEEKVGVPIIRIRDIQNNSISYYSTEEVDDKYKLNKGDVLVGMDGNFRINYWSLENCYLNQRCLRIRSTKDSISEMQAQYMIEPYIKAREKNVSKTTVAHLSARDVNDLKVIIAHPELQNKANDFFKSTLNKIVSNREQNQKLAALRDWLLPMLMNGQVTVGVAKEQLGMVAEEKIEYGG